MDQALVPFIVIFAVFLVTLVWLFFLILGRRHFNFKVNAFGIKVEVNADKGETNEQNSHS